MKRRGTEHTTLTETSVLIVRELERISGIKMIAPGIISTGRKGTRGARYLTAVYTSAGLELIISGQSVQKVAVHTDDSTTPQDIFIQLQSCKKLKNFTFKERERLPGV